MGLGISAASHLKYVRSVPKGKAFDRLDEELNEQGKTLYDVYFILAQNDRAHRARLGGMKPGLYEFTPKTRRHGFRAGSYSYFNWCARRAVHVRARLGGIRRLDVQGGLCRSAVRRTDRLHGLRRAHWHDRGREARRRLHVTRGPRRSATPPRSPTRTSPDDPDVGAGWLENYRNFALAFRLAAKDGALEFTLQRRSVKSSGAASELLRNGRSRVTRSRTWNRPN